MTVGAAPAGTLATQDRPKIGEEIAAGRALENLVVQLRGAAEHDIEDFEGHTIHIHV